MSERVERLALAFMAGRGAMRPLQHELVDGDIFDLASGRGLEPEEVDEMYDLYRAYHERAGVPVKSSASFKRDLQGVLTVGARREFGTRGLGRK